MSQAHRLPLLLLLLLMLKSTADCCKDVAYEDDDWGGGGGAGKGLHLPTVRGEAGGGEGATSQTYSCHLHPSRLIKTYPLLPHTGTGAGLGVEVGGRPYPNPNLKCS